MIYYERGISCEEFAELIIDHFEEVQNEAGNCIGCGDAAAGGADLRR